MFVLVPLLSEDVLPSEKMEEMRREGLSIAVAIVRRNNDKRGVAMG